MFAFSFLVFINVVLQCFHCFNNEYSSFKLSIKCLVRLEKSNISTFPICKCAVDIPSWTIHMNACLVINHLVESACIIRYHFTDQSNNKWSDFPYVQTM